MNTDLAEMFRYNAWANRELFEACRSLTDEQLDRQIQGISGPVRELLMHIAGGQQTFVLRTKGRQHEGELGRQSEWPGMEKVIQIAASTSDELITIAERLEPNEQVDLSYQDKSYRFPTRFFLVHAMEHSTEHRTEVKVALAHIGIETPDLDGWFYAQSAGYGQEITVKP
ncbi:MAG: DinB family protein [Anaerolineales bacterium]|nr:DinB family protein [Anaerolineales bacterium]